MQAVIIGAGGVGLGFLGELLVQSGWRITFADIDSDLVAAINAQQGYTFNKVTDRQVQQIHLSPVEAIDLNATDAQQQLADVLAGADIAFTAAGAGAFNPVGELLAGAAETTEFSRQPLNVLCCENHHDAAAALRQATEAVLGEPGLLSSRFAFVNTVVARMCQRLTSDERALPAIAPGLDTVIAAESYQLLPIDGSAAATPVPQFEGLRILSKAQFEAWDHRKLFAHNGIHALLGVLGKLKGYTYMHQCRQDLDIDAVARQALWEEVGGALLSAHSNVFTPADHEAFAADLYERITSRLFADTIERATHSTMRMISPQDGRLSRAAQFVLQQGSQPRALSLSIAGVMLLNDIPNERAPAILEHIDPDVRAELIALSQSAYQSLLAWQEGTINALWTFVA